jgi:ribosomal-protein-alanine N-acetyltransferase
MLRKYSEVLKKLLSFGKYSSVTYKERTITLGENEFLIRVVEEKDIKELLAVERDVYFGQVPWTRTAFLTELRSFAPHLYLVVVYQSEVIAFLGVRAQNRDAHITNIAVRSDFQGRGIGHFLLEQARDFGEGQHAEQLSLEVRLGNKEAQRLYRRFGFVSDSIMKNYYNETDEDALTMLYSLKEAEKSQ